MLNLAFIPVHSVERLWPVGHWLCFPMTTGLVCLSIATWNNHTVTTNQSKRVGAHKGMTIESLLANKIHRVDAHIRMTIELLLTNKIHRVDAHKGMTIELQLTNKIH